MKEKFTSLNEKCCKKNNEKMKLCLEKIYNFKWNLNSKIKLILNDSKKISGHIKFF
jgi:hypothetical protein